MKVTDLRRKLMAALAAGGLLAPGMVHAADLNTNLVINGDFEAVDINFTGAYNGPQIINWSGTPVFAYTHDGSSSSAGVGRDFADGADPPNAGHWYFTSNNAVPDIDAVGEFLQDIDVSGGQTGSTIASGAARYTLSAYMGSYLNDNDFGNIHADFLNGAGTSIGSALISDADPGPANIWSLNSAGGAIPVGTATVKVSVYGTARNGGPDAYIDNVSFVVSNQPLQPALSLTINRDSGSMTLSNQTGAAVNIRGYSITSAFESLVPANWRSIADNYDSGNPGPNQVDPAHQWSELTDPNVHGDLSEAELQSGDGSSLANARTVNLGNPGTWIQNPNEDLVFQYASSGQVFQGIVSFTGNGGQPFLEGDFNLSNSITTADWVILRTNQLANLSGKSLAEAYRLGDLTGDLRNNHADFAAFKALYDEANGSGSFVAMIGAIPEPASTALVLTTGMFVLPALRRRSSV